MFQPSLYTSFIPFTIPLSSLLSLLCFQSSLAHIFSLAGCKWVLSMTRPPSVLLCLLEHVQQSNENKKAEQKREGKGARKKFGKFQLKKSPNFGLCACTRVKYCAFLHGIYVKMLLQYEKVLF